MLECSGVNCRNAAKGVWEGEPYCGVHLASRRAADKRSAKCRLERAAPELLAALKLAWAVIGFLARYDPKPGSFTAARGEEWKEGSK